MSIKFLAEDDRPREKFLLKGKSSLSDSELLAIILGSGNNEDSAVELARKILASVDYNWQKLSKLSIKDLMKFKGIGEAKAISVAAALEIGRRKAAQEIPEKEKITSVNDMYKIFSQYLSDLQTEEFWAIFLNQKNHVIYKTQISKGGISGTLVDVRVIFRVAIEHFATSVVVAHNHPTGNLNPSQADISITRRIKEAGDLLDIKLLDHFIIGENSFFSFSEQGLL
ncbi:DNA repair protein RadC [Cloacibacterium rupense]|uniref:DNA repair protein RadC n=1 Tax=Cloacibacterium rupense TaxID=517423 RepID=A0ABQ2NFV7_9FLAO|nr:DNA repair protein RadC [Cloacibacterium rupense]GGP02302.1 DNA repair protein RadC [Cloacibacterium rupense]